MKKSKKERLEREKRVWEKRTKGMSREEKEKLKKRMKEIDKELEKIGPGLFEALESREAWKELEGLVIKIKTEQAIERDYEQVHLDALLLGYQKLFRRAVANLDETEIESHFRYLQELLERHELRDKQKELINLEELKKARKEVYKIIIPKKIEEFAFRVDSHDADLYCDLMYISRFGVDGIRKDAGKLGIELSLEQDEQLDEIRKEARAKIEKIISQDKEQKEIIRELEKDTKEEYSLSEEQYRYWDELMFTDRKKLPETLLVRLNKKAEELKVSLYELSGEIVGNIIAKWVKEQDKIKKKK